MGEDPITFSDDIGSKWKNLENSVYILCYAGRKIFFRRKWQKKLIDLHLRFSVLILLKTKYLRICGNNDEQMWTHSI